MQRTATVALGEFTLRSLGGSVTGDARTLGCSFTQAIHYYLAERGSGRPAWPYPRFLMDGHRDAGSTAEARFRIDASVWDDLSAEAARQAVAPDDLLQHVILFFLAERDAGRVARRIVRKLSGKEN